MLKEYKRNCLSYVQYFSFDTSITKGNIINKLNTDASEKCEKYIVLFAFGKFVSARLIYHNLRDKQ